MKNKDIHEWLLDEGINPLTTVTTEKGEYYLSDILGKHLTEQLRQHFIIGSFQLTDEQTKILADLGSQFIYEGVNGELRITEFGILEVLHKWKELISNDR